MKVITVHGIRRQFRWDEEFAVLPALRKHNIEVINFDFGYFTIWQFLWPPSREKVIEAFCKFYNDNVDNRNLPSAIAHSFGTYILFSAMHKYDVIRFNKIIFCGSILNSKLDFRKIFDNNQVEKIFNDHGNLEWFLKFTRIAIDRRCGKAGKSGFLDIPAQYRNRFVNRPNFKSHSDYFLPLHMEQNWIAYLTETSATFKYNNEILTNEVIERIYQNIEKNKDDFTINEIIFNVRIDESGNYFAKYEKKGINENNYSIHEFTFATTADGFHDATEMNFLSFDSANNHHHVSIENDANHLKIFKIKLDSAIAPKQSVYLKNYFCWYKTINLKLGDTDHWNIKNIYNAAFSINFPSELISPRLYEVKDRAIIGHLTPQEKIEKNGTATYYLNYSNKNNIDGLIFYFEGIQKTIISSNNKKPVEFSILGRKDKYTIDRATKKDIKEIYKIEVDIEHGNAATEDILLNRLIMFGDGFLVVKNKNNKIVGYLESLIWNEKQFQEFAEISNFPMHFNIYGDTLYVIFIAVDRSYRKKKIGTKLMHEIENVAKQYGIRRISLVAKDDLKIFYAKIGYSPTRELPNFLKGRHYKSILMEKRII